MGRPSTSTVTVNFSLWIKLIIKQPTRQLLLLASHLRHERENWDLEGGSTPHPTDVNESFRRPYSSFSDSPPKSWYSNYLDQTWATRRTLSDLTLQSTLTNNWIRAKHTLFCITKSRGLPCQALSGVNSTTTQQAFLPLSKINWWEQGKDLKIIIKSHGCICHSWLKNTG